MESEYAVSWFMSSVRNLKYGSLVWGFILILLIFRLNRYVMHAFRKRRGHDGLFEISLLQIVRSTKNFDASMNIGEGVYGSVYKSVLGHTDVAIKRFNDFMAQRVKGVRSLKHPNIITLLGIEYETPALVYEFMPCGNLDDHLTCKDNMKPLSCGQRIKIIKEICQALMHLHSFNPPIIHGNLKPQNVLFDANFVTKLSDFGMSWMSDECANHAFVFGRIYPKDSIIYLDPQFFMDAATCLSSDVYAFGLIVLRILTGKSPFNLRKDVKTALKMNCLDMILDESVGQWPIEKIEELARVAVKCCKWKRERRPDLVQVWNVVQQIDKTISADTSSPSPSFKSVSAKFSPPAYFNCPILWDIMRDPVVASDGFTYGRKAIKQWFISGHDTSPMTNEKLPNRNLLSNLTLRYAIKEWLDNNSDDLKEN